MQQLTMMSTRLASPLRVLFSPKAFTRVVMFFLGSGRLMARMAGLWGFLKYLLISCNTKHFMFILYLTVWDVEPVVIHHNQTNKE